MEKVKVYYDKAGNTLIVWFGESKDEYICEETGDEIILMKDRTGRVLGFEKLNYLSNPNVNMNIVFETATV
ncbi:MAG TPA: DUF2283 domain-containing protein [Spirochaetota bacterium]|nr:DUF2283 domain-containing protein [Spirochaetota bacterium]HQP49451.1 DUF2283 domain-containing protein [Spirochaetota bacterium]